jgi:FlaA1/EpsC-like NDP-sugar epimerase
LRAAVFFAGDLAVWVVALYLAFLIRFDWRIPSLYLDDPPVLLLLFVPVKAAWNWVFRLYQISWRSVGLSELLNIFKAAGAASLTIAAGLVLLRPIDAFHEFPRSVLVMDFVLSFCGVGLVRVSRRIWQRQFDRRRRASEDSRRLLLVGAGAAGTRLAQAMEESPQNGYYPVGFIDDDPSKWGTYIHGLRVFGGRASIPDAVAQNDVDEVLIAIPSAPSR